MGPQLRCVILTSSVKKELEITEAEQMLAVSKQGRIERGITGLVIFAYSNTLMLIEGDHENVEKELKEVRTHNGHNSIIKMFDKPVSQRFFTDYPLAFKSISKDLRQFDDFKESEQEEYLNLFLELDNPISRIVANFIKNNH